MALRRGFQAEAKRLATEVRKDLGLSATDALNPWQLAEHLAIPIIPLSDFAVDAPSACEVLLGDEVGAFSAMVTTIGLYRAIVHNDGHALTRQRANICHEIAHVLLFHEPMVLEGPWHTSYNAEQEDEAKFLGAVLLVTDDACLQGCRLELSVPESADRLGVSVDLMRWRRNKSGAERRVQRERARHAA